MCHTTHYIRAILFLGFFSFCVNVYSNCQGVAGLVVEESGSKKISLSNSDSGGTHYTSEVFQLLQGYSPEQEFLFNIFKSRRSIRKFKPTQIPQEHILKILDIARTAPTAGNQQPWKFLVIQDRDKILQLKERQIVSALQNRSKNENIDSVRYALNSLYAGYLSAPLFIVVLTDKESKYPGYNIKDGALAAGYLIVAARALGYGSVFTTDSFSENIIKELFNIPDNFKQICFIPVGVPEEWPAPPEKKPLDDLIVFGQFSNSGSDQVDYPLKVIILKPDVIKMYTGKYSFKEELMIEIFQKDNRLYMQSKGSEPIEIFATKEDEFSLKDANASITFFRNPDGQVAGFTADFEGITYRTIKIE